jgi:hypothetical protein
MEKYCSTGQSPQRAVAPTEEEEEEEEYRPTQKGRISEQDSKTWYCKGFEEK